MKSKPKKLTINVDESTYKKLKIAGKELGMAAPNVAEYFVINGDEDGIGDFSNKLDEFIELLKANVDANIILMKEVNKQNKIFRDLLSRPQKIMGKFQLPEDIIKIADKRFEEMWKGGNIEQMSKQQREVYYAMFIDKIIDEYITKQLMEGNTYIFKERLRHHLIWYCVRFVRDKMVEKKTGGNYGD